jgi:hypothetical protein
MILDIEDRHDNARRNRVGAIDMATPNEPTENSVASRCYGVVTHQQLEILYLVSRLPRGYIDIRRDVLIADYAHLLHARQAWEAFLAMIGLAEIGSLSEKGRACLRSFARRKDYRAFCQSP